MQVRIDALEHSLDPAALAALINASDAVARAGRVFAELAPMPDRPAVADEGERLFAPGPRGAVMDLPGYA